jgi:hypothetical protein
LGVSGDDGDDLIKAFAEKFSVDISEFNSAIHFGTEGFPIFSLFKPIRIEKNLKVTDLIDAIKTGRLS